MAIVKKPINEMSDASARALYNLFDSKGLSSLIAYTPTGSYAGVVDLEKNYYYSHTQTTNLSFTAINATTKPFTIFQLTLNANNDYTIEFSADFLIYRNDIDTAVDGIYHIWFCALPGGSIGTSIIKVGTYTPVVASAPYVANLVNRYNYSNVVVDGLSGKVSEITSLQNSAFSLFSTTDATRPVLSIANKRIEFSNVAVTENKAATLFIDSTVWSVVFLTQFDGDFNGSATVTLMSNLSAKMLSPYTNTVTGYINNVLMSLTTSESLARGAVGVHVHALIQTVSALEYYIDGVLVKTQATSGTGLTLTNILSIYNATRAQAGKIKYFYDAMFYNIALDSSKLTEVTSYLGSVYANFKPSEGPVISSFALTNITQGQNVTAGDTINFSYTVDSGTVAEVYVYFMTGTATYKVVVKGNTSNSVLVPSGLSVLSGVWCKVLAVDSNGRSSNFSGTNAITFNRV